MTLEEKVEVYKQLRAKLEELEEQRKQVVEEILGLMPQGTDVVQLADCQVKRVCRLSIRTSLADAKKFEAVKTEEVPDKKKIKQLVENGLFVPGVSEMKYIIVSKMKEGVVS